MQDDFNHYAMDDSAAAFARYAYKDTLILDVDDCLYPIDNAKNPALPGLHSEIKKLIIQNWNERASLPLKSHLAQNLAELSRNNEGFSGIDAHALKDTDLKLAFPQMLASVQAKEPDRLWEWLDKFYGDKYDEILSPDPALVEGLTLFEKTGGRIIIYTNGPSHRDVGGVAHTQKILTHAGFDQNFIERVRPNTLDLIMSSRFGHGKPAAESFAYLLRMFDIHPQRSLMLDDGVANLATARQFGVEGLWTWTSQKTPAQNDMDMAAKIALPRVQNTGESILMLAKHREEMLDLGLLNRPIPTPQLMAG